MISCYDTLSMLLAGANEMKDIESNEKEKLESNGYGMEEEKG